MLWWSGITRWWVLTLHLIRQRSTLYFWKKQLFDCCCLLLSVKWATGLECAVKEGVNLKKNLQLYFHHLVLWWTGITRWWMLTLQHRWRLNSTFPSKQFFDFRIVCCCQWSGWQVWGVGSTRGWIWRKILQLYSNSTLGAVMNQGHQMVNVNLPTQMKVEFKLIEGYNYFDCCCPLL